MTFPQWMIRRKKPLLAAGAVLAALLLALYFWALFRPGYWYDGIFLARRQAGCFPGRTTEPPALCGWNRAKAKPRFPSP